MAQSGSFVYHFDIFSGNLLIANWRCGVDVKGLQQIRLELETGSFDFTRHALRRVVERNISQLEIRQAGQNAIIIEQYPGDKYSPSCLLWGFTTYGRPLHIHVSLADAEGVRIITIYEPDESEWVGYSVRR